ncbi:hypothetical protein K491DRAFT_783599 [Lophiostoma macrostomum CBS 122681]|uniref:Zn(2)-C6 fungal-type domain-containing protein n=1 Tax=Lophiostoma macrostomum CBS 122681 TaxID=1314788 RepID=A0A6A6SMF3_9PLEO|nr:hypothetical protein K491DRAFT_783599 [Lophiostoma macrostomum CBS 122681]
MTRTGKCDTCRTRKVKCDEIKPKCSACRKKDRNCSYNYGKATALVQEDPNQFTGHGKPKTAPIILPLRDLRNPETRLWRPDSCSTSENDVADTSIVSVAQEGTVVGPQTTFGGAGDFLLLPRIYQEWRRTIPTLLSGTDDTLAARFIAMTGVQAPDLSPTSVHNSWIESVPSRIGSSSVLDAAVEYAVNSFACFANNNEAMKKVALVSRSRALKELRKSLTDGRATDRYDVLIATRLHAYAEIYVAVGTYAYLTHCIALSNLLRSGSASGLDEEHYWSLVDNTYSDEVTDALVTGRHSIFDTKKYLAMTYPQTFDPTTIDTQSLFRLASRSIMHCFIQLPRLACLIRLSKSAPENADQLASALMLGKKLWKLDCESTLEYILQNYSVGVATPPCPDIADIVPETLHFKFLDPSLSFCKRYWVSRIHLASLLGTLWYHFPGQCFEADMPSLMVVQKTEIQAAACITQTLVYSMGFSKILPLLPLRVLGPLSMSIGAWYRMILHLTQILYIIGPQSKNYAFYASQLEKATRMEQWVIDRCNKLHLTWGLFETKRSTYESICQAIAGGSIMDWLRLRVEIKLTDLEAMERAITETVESDIREWPYVRYWRLQREHFEHGHGTGNDVPWGMDGMHDFFSEPLGYTIEQREASTIWSGNGSDAAGGRADPERLPQPTPPEACNGRRTLLHSPFLSAAAATRLKYSLVAEKECEWKICRDFHVVLQRMLFDPTCPVVKVEEVKFSTKRLDDDTIWQHSIFRLTLEVGSMVSFDPTGVQLGPEWPLLRGWGDYKSEYIQSPNPRIEPFGSKVVRWNLGDGFTPPVRVARKVEEGYDGDGEGDGS